MISTRHLELLGIRPIYERYFPLEEGEISSLSSVLGTSIPQDFRELVSQYGCAYFPGRRIVVETIASPPPHISEGRNLLISSFFGGGTKKHRLLQQMQIYRGRIPRHMLPIASDYNTNVFCLSVGGDDAGKVFFWDSTCEPDRDEYTSQGLSVPNNLDYSNMTLVADSLQDFLDRLRQK